jgi:hypothetical protein
MNPGGAFLFEETQLAVAQNNYQLRRRDQVLEWKD